MHHYGEDSTNVIPTEAAFEGTFTNKESGQQITMHIPRVGVREDSRTPTVSEVKSLSDDVAHLLRERLYAFLELAMLENAANELEENRTRAETAPRVPALRSESTWWRRSVT
jgi:hypothetical protein